MLDGLIMQEYLQLYGDSGEMNRQPLDFGYPIFGQTHIHVLFWHAFIYTFIV